MQRICYSIHILLWIDYSQSNPAETVFNPLNICAIGWTEFDPK